METQHIQKNINIMGNITLVLCTIHVTIHFSLKRQASAANGPTDFHIYRRFYSSLNTLSMILLFLFTTMVSIVITVIKTRLMRMRCVPTEGIYLYARSCAFHKSKRTRSFLECNEIPILKKLGNLPESSSIKNV